MKKKQAELKGEYIYEPSPERLKMAFDYLANIILEKLDAKKNAEANRSILNKSILSQRATEKKLVV